jgi:sugar lactone lactonase YvrE
MLSLMKPNVHLIRSRPRFGSQCTTLYLLLVILLMTAGCQALLDHRDPPQTTAFASGLIAPLGVETDAKGQLWVTQAGSGTANDGQLSMITPQGEVWPVVTGFTSQVSPEGAVFGLNHLLLQGTTLYLVHGVEGRLYTFDTKKFQPGHPPVSAQSLAYEAVGDWVRAYSFVDDTDETDLFNLTIGPEGDLFIVDAAANAIIRRNATTHALSVFATIPPIITTGIDTLEAVPTGIVFDGQRFLVSNFTGYPYPAGRATIYQYDLQGNESTFQTGLTTLTDIELDENGQPLVLEYGTWTGQGFADKSGTIVRSTAQSNIRLLGGLNYPNSIKRSSNNTYYIAQTFDGTIQKITL